MGFFDRDISNALLGKRVREAQDRHRLYVAENTPIWINEGAQMRARRESDKRISRCLSPNSRKI